MQIQLSPFCKLFFMNSMHKYSYVFNWDVLNIKLGGGGGGVLGNDKNK